MPSPSEFARKHTPDSDPTREWVYAAKFYDRKKSVRIPANHLFSNLAVIAAELVVFDPGVKVLHVQTGAVFFGRALGYSKRPALS